MSMPFRPAKARGIVAVRADASGDIKTLLAQLQTDWETFKSTAAEKDKEVAAKFDDVVTTEKFDRINTSVSELQAAVDQANAKLAAMTIAAGQAETIPDQEYTDAFRAHFRKGDVQANLNKGADAEGGYLAPVEWDRTVTNALIEVSPVRQIAATQMISGTGYTKLYNLRGTASGWVGETDVRPETGTATFAPMAITTGELYANPSATQQMLDDAEVNLEQWLAGEVNTEFALREGQAFVAGNGVNKPYGFLTFAAGAANAGRCPLGAIEVLPAASPTDVTEDELLDVIYKVPSSYTQGARFVMNRTSMGRIRKLRDADGRQLWQPSTEAGQPSQLLAYPLTELPDMPDMQAGAMGIAFGNFQRGYLIIDRVGVRILRDPYTAKPNVMFYTTKRVGGSVIDPQGLKILQMAAA